MPSDHHHFHHHIWAGLQSSGKKGRAVARLLRAFHSVGYRGGCADKSGDGRDNHHPPIVSEKPPIGYSHQGGPTITGKLMLKLPAQVLQPPRWSNTGLPVGITTSVSKDFGERSATLAPDPTGFTVNRIAVMAFLAYRPTFPTYNNACHEADQ